MPASTSAWIVSGRSEAGPIVAMSFVRGSGHLAAMIARSPAGPPASPKLRIRFHRRRTVRDPDGTEMADGRRPLDDLGIAGSVPSVRAWFRDAVAANLAQPEAMALATSTPDGRPSVRMVLLKAFDERGFVFYTNADSRKGRELQANPPASIAVHWEGLHRQVRAAGTVTLVASDESDAYFASRPRGAQLAAAASTQSRVIGVEGRADR